jgi:hypothetical protein
MNDEIKERLQKVEELMSTGLTATESCKKLGLQQGWYHSARHRYGLKKIRIVSKPKGKKKKTAPTIVNVAIPDHVPSGELRVVVLRGDSNTVREIVQGLAGVFNA